MVAEPILVTQDKVKRTLYCTKVSHMMLLSMVLDTTQCLQLPSADIWQLVQYS